MKYTLTIVFFLLLSCNNSDFNTKNVTEKTTNTLFKKILSKDSGLNFSNTISVNLNTNQNVLAYQYYYRGAGVAIGDINNDGLEDVFFTANEQTNKLFLNKGDLKFEDISLKSGISKLGWSTGATMVDINNDGFLDIYVCQAGPEKGVKRKNLLYINSGNNTFIESANEYGLADDNISRNATFFDFDKDGDLDCYVLNESVYTRKSDAFISEELKIKDNLKKCSGKLFENIGKSKFKDITEESGLLHYGFGLCSNVTDINNDGWLDLYITNDFTIPDKMFINNGNGTFTDEIKSRTKNISWAAMGMDIADINNDLLPDVFSVEMASKDHFMDKTLMPSMNEELFYNLIDNLDYQRQYKFNSLQLNNGDGTYSNIAALSNLLKSEWSWSTLLADFDNDGLKDCIITNGLRVYYTDKDSQNKLKQVKRENKGSFPLEQRQAFYNSLPVRKSKNLIFKNEGDLIFKDYSKDWGINEETFSNGVSYADLDNDGDLDLVINNIDQESFLYENMSMKNNFLKLDLISSRPIIGTKAILEYNNQKQILEYNPYRGYLSSVSQKLIFGIGENDKIDKLTIIWPDNKFQEFTDLKLNTLNSISYNENLKSKSFKDNKPFLNLEEDLNVSKLFIHKESNYNDFDEEVLLPYKQSTLGPFISVADINFDGLDDFFISGASGQASELFVQNLDGTFKSISGPWKKEHLKDEHLGSLFFDVDNDKDLDLFVLNGSNEFSKETNFQKARLYINDGNMKFSYTENSIPKLPHIGLKAMNLDIDNDGDEDIFIGGRLRLKNYPLIPESFVLINDGKGKFLDESKKWLGNNKNIGIVNDILKEDFNNDGKADLILVGEFMPISFLINQGDSFILENKKYIDESFNNWAFSIKLADLDNDGDKDLLIGNLGLNSKFLASNEEPFEIITNDFDSSGTIDVVITKKYKGKTVPSRGRECSSEQMPFIADKFENYTKFANASIDDILGKENVIKAHKSSAQNFETLMYENKDGRFFRHFLPNIVQSFPIQDILVDDFNSDDLNDILLAGNLYNMEIETPRIDAGNGLILIGKGNLEFKPLNKKESNLNIPLESKSIAKIRTKNGLLFLFTQNNGPLKGYTLNKNQY